MPKSALYIWLSMAVFIASAAIYVTIEPGAVFTHDGISYYGNSSKTFLPYSLGLVATAYLLLRACRTLAALHTRAAKNFRAGLEFVAIGLLGIVATPSKSTLWAIQNLHVLFGFVIFITQAALSLRFLIKVRGEAMDWMLLASQLTAITLALLSFETINVIHLMLPAQILAISAFWLLLIRAVIYRNNHVEL